MKGNNDEELEILGLDDNEVEGAVSDKAEALDDNSNGSVSNTNNDTNKDVDKSKNGIVPIIIVGLLVTGVALLFLLNPRDSNNVSKKNTNSKSGVVDKNKKKESDTDSEKVDDSLSSESSTIESDDVRDIDITKPINSTGYNYSDVSDSNQNVGVSIRINDDKKSITISLDGNASKIISDVIQSTRTDQTIEKVISGFDRNIKSTYIGGLGQDVTGTIFYFLMEDGTVQYIRMFELKNNSDGTTYYTTEIHQGIATINKVDGVSGVVKLYGANAVKSMSTGSYTTLAALKDGSFYDLGRIIN